MHIYAFGSLCRGEVFRDSDVDLLAIVDGLDDRFDPDKYSIYSYSRIKKLWSEGSPFAWHLAIESRLLFASDSTDFIQGLSKPSRYAACTADCRKFHEVFREARLSLRESLGNRVFDLSALFLSIRNISTCFALGALGQAVFSRHAALGLPPQFHLPISEPCYRILERARILCTRSFGLDITEKEARLVLAEIGLIDEWMRMLEQEAQEHDRVQQSN